MKNAIKHIYIGLLAIMPPCLGRAQVPFPDLIIENVTHNNQNVNYQNSHGITSPSTSTLPVLITGTSQVEYKAGTRISLKPGFKASSLTGTGRFHALIAAPDFEVVILSPTSTPGTVGKFEMFEMGLKLPANVNQLVDDYLVNNNPNGINPYDPDEISITASFTSPSGTQNRTIYGFYMKDYIRNYANSTWDPNTATANYPWRIRFAPTEISPISPWTPWTCTITISSPYFSTLTVSNLKFDCVASSNKGYLQAGLHKRQLKFSGTGESFFGVGQNLPWPEGWDMAEFGGVAGFTTYTDNWQTNLAYYNGNFMRLVVAPWGHEFEWEKLGDYNGRQTNAWELDKVMKTAEEKGIYVLLNLTMHTNFQAFSAHPENNLTNSWENNPYNSSSIHNGGAFSSPVTTPHEFLLNVDAIKYFKKRLRYFVARWGYSTNLAAYELLSEVDQHDGYTSSVNHQGNMGIWHVIMSNYIKNDLSETRHLISTSYANNPGQYADGSYNYMDFTSRHKYGNDRTVNFQRADMTNFNTSTWDKPFIFGELGFIPDPNTGNPLTTTDPYDIEGCDDVSFHNSMWSAAFYGSFSTGLNWWQHRNNTYRQQNFPAAKAFFNGVDFETNKFTYTQAWSSSTRILCGLPWPSVNVCNYKFEVFALRNFDKEKAIAWAHNATNYWHNVHPNCTDHNGNTMNAPKDDDNYTSPTVFNTTPSAKIEIHGLKRLKKYNVYTYSTRGAGGQVASSLIKVNISGTLKIPFATSEYDWAYKIVKDGVTFRTTGGNPETHEAATEIDTLVCPIDTIHADGVYEDDLDGVFDYSWNFGNGQTSTLVNPKIYYSSPGMYTVTLIVTDTLGGKDTLSQQIYVPNCNSRLTTSIDDEKPKNDYTLYPNPSSGSMTLDYTLDAGNRGEVTIMDLLGKKLSSYKLTEGENTLHINETYLNEGLYLYNVIINGAVVKTDKMVIVK